MPELNELVKVTLDKERHLRLTLKGMLEFEKLTGKNLLKGFNFGEMTLEDSAALMWACLLHEDKKLTFDDFLRMIDFSNLMIMIEALTRCINQALPKADSGDSPLEETSQLG